MSARHLGRALVYLRRSDSHQELGIHNQLEWAIAEAAKHRVSLDAAPMDLDLMEREGLNQYKAIYLDDGITGANLQREAFTLFRNTALRDKSISHLFAFKSDRFARPEQPNAACTMDTKVCEILSAFMTSW
jgi:hypothetical protein